jgi:hypothetical protein
VPARRSVCLRRNASCRQALRHAGVAIPLLSLVAQNHLLDYMRAEFDFAYLGNARVGDTMHFHSYKLSESGATWRLELDSRVSTDAEGIAKCLGLQAEPKVELEIIIAELEKKMSSNTVLTLGPAPLSPMEQMPTE